MLGFVVGILAGVGIFVGAWAFMKRSRLFGAIEVVLSIIAMVVTILVCQAKEAAKFDGSDFDFLGQALMTDHMLTAWLLVILIAAVVVLGVINIIKIRASRTTGNTRRRR